jgi:hypothetical protein
MFLLQYIRVCDIISYVENLWPIYVGLSLKPYFHYVKLRPPKPHYHVLKTQKTYCIQLLCNYPLGITTIVQLSLYKYGILINKLSCQKIN